MKSIKFTPKEDFLERLSKAGAIQAVSELIWNGLDAGSDSIEIELEQNEMQGLETIRVRDYGNGIFYPHLDALFGDLGDSWKKEKPKVNGRAVHGKKGQGRLKAFALGDDVRWKTVYQDEDSKKKTYTIHARSSGLEKMVCSDPTIVSEDVRVGTEVVVGAIEKSHGALLSDTANSDLAKIFAPYLSQYPDVSIIYNRNKIDPGEHQLRTKEIQLDPIELPDGRNVNVSVSIIEWDLDTERETHLCDADGFSLLKTKAIRIKAPGFNFTAYIKTDYFLELEQRGDLVLEDSIPNVDRIVRQSKQAISKYFRKRLAEEQSGAVERWKREKIYPFEDKTSVDPVEEAERQVFDILAINVESYLPHFEDADEKSKKFTFRLIAQALKQNPESVQEIITEVLNLKKEHREDLAELMKQTSLTSIISTAKTVANRLNFLVGLENLLFDKDTKEKLLERDQLHKILDNEAWIFDEEFGLAGTEQRLEEVLEKHIGVLGAREDGSTVVEVGEGKTGRVDLMLSKTNQPRTGEFDYLIVELKRPKKKIDESVVSQVKKYAKAVANDERFHGVPATWKFLAVSNELNSEARDDANQHGQPKGRVWTSKDGKISAWVIEWAELINNARARLGFINQTLEYNATRETATEYLHKAYAKFIPEMEEDSEELAEVAESTT